MKVFIEHDIPLIIGEDEKAVPKNVIQSNAEGTANKFEQTCEQIRKDNEQLLEEFGQWLLSKRLQPRTIRAHKENVGFFINEFLLHMNVMNISDGIGEVCDYFGDWFIRKAMWSTPRTIKSSTTSIHKFYSFLAESGKITLKKLAKLKETIALNLPEWQARCERYNDGDIEDWRGIEQPI